MIDDMYDAKIDSMPDSNSDTILNFNVYIFVRSYHDCKPFRTSDLFTDFQT
jgi:hypothetical protein